MPCEEAVIVKRTWPLDPRRKASAPARLLATSAELRWAVADALNALAAALDRAGERCNEAGHRLIGAAAAADDTDEAQPQGGAES